MPNQTGMAITCLPIKTCPVEDDWRLSLNPGEPGRARTKPGHRPHTQAQPLHKIIEVRGDRRGLGWPQEGRAHETGTGAAVQSRRRGRSWTSAAL